MFDPSIVKNDCKKEFFAPLNKNFYIYDNHMFRNGFLYLLIKASKLIGQNVGPKLEEVSRFQKKATSFDDF